MKMQIITTTATAALDYFYDSTTTTIETPTTEMPLTDLITPAAAGSVAADVLNSEPHHNQITFEIPSHRDLEHINNLHSFNTLLRRIGNVAYDTVATAGVDRHINMPFGVDASGHVITNEQISKSAVLNLADLKSPTSHGLERFFAGSDMHSIINYLWIGVVTALVILSIVFILFSCYFYRKFREWKKCNKDIRNGIYASGNIVTCDRLINNVVPTTADAAYYQIESPPCYTIATGLPTYDEALHHQHFSALNMKCMFPAIAATATATAIHHHHHHHSVMNGNIVSNWEKEDFTLKCKEAPQQQQQQQQEHYNKQRQHVQYVEKQQQQQLKAKSFKASTMIEAPPAYDVAASMALLAETNEHDKSEVQHICILSLSSGAEAGTIKPNTADETKSSDDNCIDAVVVVA